MSSNIKFESNIYPVVGTIYSDREFVSKIWDYNRLRAIEQKGYQYVPLSELQRRIIKEQPTCSLNKEDPCWGMVKSGAEYRWVSMCTKTECPQFSACRSKIPYDVEKESNFIPRDDLNDEYGYEKFITEYSAYPVLIGDDVNYEFEQELIRRKNLSENETECSGGAFFKQLMMGNSTASQLSGDSDVEENVCSNEIEEEVAFSEFLEEPITVDVKDERNAKLEDDINNPSLNVFEYFKEGTQREIITASSKENFFVDAGPGTGKTYTLIQKLNHMVSVEGVEADGILVLCFTNAAVDEIKKRLRQHVVNGADRSLVNVDIRTFHSFAWWLINQANTHLADEGWHYIDMHELSYETSLIQACTIISRYGKKVVGNWEYFIVDEVQDLTNTRGRFVLQIVNACLSVDCGVTVLGDACQAIYDYEQDTCGMELKSGDFYRALFRKMHGKTKFVYLEENHRQEEELIKLTKGLRAAILSDDISQMSSAVNEFGEAVELCNVNSANINNSLLDKEKNKGSVCMLFRNNGQTLKMSSDLRKRGVSHTLNIAETKNNFAPWIVDIFGEYKKSTISEDKFLDLYEETTGQNGDEIWGRLQKLLHTENDVLNIRELLDAIAVSKIDDSLLRTNKSQNVIVSNIHRSKGREYECVIVDRSFVDSFSTDSPPEEYKTLYVAITRPKKKLLLAPLQDKSGMKVITIFATGARRWGKTKGRKISYLEFNAAKDITCEVFANASPVLFDNIQIGDPIFLKRNLKNGKLEYQIIHEYTENCLGYIDELSPYVQDFMSYMKIGKNSYIELPQMIDDFYVSGIYSQVVDSKYLELHPEIRDMAPNGVWKWIELVGIGHADYDVY